jgi:hypothetical protein
MAAGVAQEVQHLCKHEVPYFKIKRRIKKKGFKSRRYLKGRF